jgi:hypothetical protein
MFWAPFSDRNAVKIVHSVYAFMQSARSKILIFPMGTKFQRQSLKVAEENYGKYKRKSNY